MDTTAKPGLDPSRDVATEVRPIETTSGWWILPMLLAGAGVWIGVFVLIF